MLSAQLDSNSLEVVSSMLLEGTVIASSAGGSSLDWSDLKKFFLIYFALLIMSCPFFAEFSHSRNSTEFSHGPKEERWTGDFIHLLLFSK